MKSWKIAFLLVTVFLLSACGGGSDTPTVTVSGVAATGVPLTGTVYLKDSSNPSKEISRLISSDGSYSFDVTGLTAPFMLKAVGTANGQNYTLYSLAGTPGVANINPLSHLAIVRANYGVDPSSLYLNLTAAQVQTIKDALVTIIPQIKTLLQQVLAQYGVSTTDFISDKYVANHTGLDLLFDLISITTNNGSLIITNKLNSAPILTTTLSANTLSGQITADNIPVVASQTTGFVYSYPASLSVTPGSSVTFAAIIIGTDNQSVVWSVVESGGGSISSQGVYTAPSAAGTYHVKATSKADNSKTAISTITVTAGPSDTSTQIWVTDSSVTPAVTISVGPSIGTNSYITYHSGTISSSFLGSDPIVINQISSTSYIVTMYDSSMLIGTTKGNYLILIGTDYITSGATKIGATINIYNGLTPLYSGTAYLIKQ